MNIYKYIIGLVLCISFHANATWRQDFYNNTDGEVFVRVIYTNPDICPIKENVIPAGGNLHLEYSSGVRAGKCCATDIELYARSGKAAGQVYKYTIPSLPPIGTCALVLVNIFLTTDNNLTADVSVRR
ncbi:MAG TPA: hypothetical protein VGW78_03740 [Candidatus Babeliales bacterium]|nr:hypothetical protein [Candidatus Babeliales bacterium]